MNKNQPQENLTKLMGFLDKLRSRIRMFVCLEGFSFLALAIVAIFWIVLAIDYLPVLMGLSESPQGFRLILLLVTVLFSLGLIFKLIFSRLAVALKDESMALLFERKYPELRDSLATVINQVNENLPKHSQEMLDSSAAQAIEGLQRVELGPILRTKRIGQLVAGSLGAILTIVLLALLAPSTANIAFQRLVLLRDIEWPRSCHIEITGVRVVREDPNPALTSGAENLTFVDQKIKVAKGSDLVLLVRAEAGEKGSGRHRTPNRCIVYYTTEDGESGFQYLNKVGTVADGMQEFEFDKKPFKGILNSMKISVRGDDHTVRGYEIEVVDPPSVVETQVACEFPKYMVDEKSGAWTPRTERVVAGTQLPVGTKYQLLVKASKPLTTVYAYNPTENRTQEVRVVNGDTILIDQGELSSEIAWDLTLRDRDGVLSETPFRVTVGAFEDTAPKVSTQVLGIGSAVTPDVMIPFAGKIVDDFGVAKSWIEVAVPDHGPITQGFDLVDGEDVQAKIDFRALRQADQDGFTLLPDQGQRISFNVFANDKYDLGMEPNKGGGDEMTVEVVSPSRLLRILEQREAAQRRLMEQIFEEMTSAHGLLIRIRELDSENPSQTAEKEGASGTIQSAELRLLFSQRVFLQTQKSRDETKAIIETFKNIRDQLVNNRVDTEDRKERIDTIIVAPLQNVTGALFPKLETELQALQNRLAADLQANATGDASAETKASLEASVDSMQQLLQAMDEVIRQLIRLESYGEFLEAIDQLIKEQEALIEQTEKERKRQAFEDLLK